MRIVLHVGMGKTGTTTLQRTFRARRSTLVQAGVLYPTQHRFPLQHHQALMCLAGVEPARLGREFGEIRDRPPADVTALGEQFWVDVCAEARDANAEVMILSYESLLYLDQEHLMVLRDRLRELTPEIDVVAYVRHPSTHWLAVAQQRVKADHTLNPPGRYHNRIRRHLELFDDVFDGALAVRPFDREALVDGCIVADFLHHYVPGGDLLRSRIDVESANESMSGEAMCILQDLRRHVFADRPGQFLPASDEVLTVLRELLAATPQTAPTLRPGIASRLTETHRDDLDWLEERFGVRYPSFVESEVDEAVTPDTLESTQLRDILDVSAEAIDETLFALVASLAERAHRGARAEAERSAENV